jgi:hypothetical protein
VVYFTPNHRTDKKASQAHPPRPYDERQAWAKEAEIGMGETVDITSSFTKTIRDTFRDTGKAFAALTAVSKLRLRVDSITEDEQCAITSAMRKQIEAAQYHSVITPAPAIELIRLKPNIKKRNMNS